ncbi:HAD family hydrolase [Phyllobacterium myrsinacearum]|uniref:Putative hydrolase of the HAD superfamily n=1 Tax=Phyllobacterium myrsinacearum TaxID=28101 RepID=A0A839EKI0_9HYPH|nr:HAD family hydrolase [Phyllobacterium myrsinacearum]MBA8880943.1 putative hydrolase of the HAD superfamily [Phyllobacterium myrsinacearum]
MIIFFDVDGVLINGWHANPSLRKPWDLNIEKDLGVDRGGFQRRFFGIDGFRHLSPMAECASGRRDLKEALRKILPSVGFSGPVDDFVKYWFEKDSLINDDVMKLVRRLADDGEIKLFLATGQEHYRARYLWDDLGFRHHFDGIFYSASIGFSKKERQFFQAINRALDISPDEKPLFFDDQPEIISLANEAGWDGKEFISVEDIQNHRRLVHIWR